MADRPFGPWVDGSPGPTSTDPLARSGLAPFASLYRACAQLGISPLEADAMEVWQIAAALGVQENKKQGLTLDQVQQRQADQAARRAARLHAQQQSDT